ncbi:ABC-2 type transporter [Coriobacterium glomerans PW2]|uniref:Transport permease protein n=1 Tax=Coriobacterium glomerans (strain ATCC 49209 / DSM 20642 / JCM 10262 / PW2) TaxID=700015 RepID=F2N9P1_CORGP|nr:ABC transporter permease [Coriobacterium glomerans]AEB07144.1 ABC-2 type transporter [Coriobacterium glomerans PW2]
MPDSSTIRTNSHAGSDVEKDIFILRQLVTKDFKIKYRRSRLGVAWSVLNPLLMMIVMAIVFTTMFAQAEGGGIPNYPLYLILGNVTFSLMSDSTSQALMSIFSASALLKKVRVHRFVFPVQKVLFSLVNFGFSLIAVALVMLWFRIIPTWHVVWLPVCLLLLVAFCMGLGLLLSALTVFFRDIMHLWSVVLTAWTYFTPIFWRVDFIQTMPHALRVLMYANPMYNYLTFMRQIFLYQANPAPITLVMCTGWAVFALLIGYTVFHRTEHRFILYI